jgi:hypothetical protein
LLSYRVFYNKSKYKGSKSRKIQQIK